MHAGEAKKRKKISNSRTENTICGSEAVSAERRLTKRTTRDDEDAAKNEIKNLTKNIQLGKEVINCIKDLKSAQHSLRQI